MGLKSFLISFLRIILRNIDSCLERLRLKSFARKVLVHIASVIVCFAFVTFFYFILYFLLIPSIHQTTRLNLVRSQNGYTSRILNFDHNFSTCSNPKLDRENSHESNKAHLKTCADPFNILDHDLTFHQETYSIKLKMNIPNTDHNNEIGIVPVKAELINQKNEIFELHSMATLHSRRPGLIRKILDKIWMFIGFSPSNRDVEVVLSEKFANNAFDISVINIEINEPKLLMNSAELEMVVLLKGVRRILHDWFWTSAFIVINLGAWGLYFFLSKGVRIVDVIESRRKIVRKSGRPIRTDYDDDDDKRD